MTFKQFLEETKMYGANEELIDLVRLHMGQIHLNTIDEWLLDAYKAGKMNHEEVPIMGRNVKNLDPNCRLGCDAKRYCDIKGWAEFVLYTQISGDGYVHFGMREKLPSYTQQPYFTDTNGSKYDQWETAVSIYEIIEVCGANHG